MKYDKPPLSIDQQIELLISRGMEITDRKRAARYLSHLNYYRLRAYWLIFEEPAGAGEHHFKPGTKFEDSLSLYVFDRKLRMLVIEAIERVEVSFRTRFAYMLGNRYDSHAYLRTDLFFSEAIHKQCIESLREEFVRSTETFIEHYKVKYDHPDLPPVWAACEIMSLGQLSKWFHNLKKKNDRKDISDIYNLDESVLRSFMHNLTHVRNFAAHHSRLWNRKLTITMSIPRRPGKIVCFFNPMANRNIYNTLAMLAYLLKLMSPGTTWPQRVMSLIEEYSIVDTNLMGFPFNWQEMALWNIES